MASSGSSSENRLVSGHGFEGLLSQLGDVSYTAPYELNINDNDKNSFPPASTPTWCALCVATLRISLIRNIYYAGIICVTFSEPFTGICNL